ncbi:hypothetical protein G2W53_027235 [Senna tora]|uniref:Putative plant transposon protein domain-containing protein n=1 Tax=Senna tora TaxID=362788 RepID=A0A834WFV6_9FABA|nr:hypothetical protein G2W53_027235 [Senna tora]
MQKRSKRATTSEELTPQEVKKHVKGRKLAQPRPEGNLAYVRNFYCSLEPYMEIEKALCIAGIGWETQANEDGQSYIYKRNLNNNASIWLHFMSHNLMPSSHSSDISPDQAHLLYLLRRQRPLKPLNYGLLEFVEEVIGGGILHRHSREKCTAKRIRTKGATDGLDKKMGLLLKGLEDHRRETHEAFQFLYRNQMEIVEAGHITLNTVPPPYFTKSYPVAPADTPTSSRRGKEKMTMIDSEDDNDEMAKGDSEEF